MRRFIPIALAAAGIVAVAAAASAQPAEPWTGAYFGTFASDALGRSDRTTTIDCTVSGLLCAPPDTQFDSAAFVGATGSGPASGSAFSAGGFGGYQWQDGDAVYGLETDVGSLPLHLAVATSAASQNPGLQNDGPVPSVFTVTDGASSEWMATARARFGFLPVPTLLLYGTAGLAATELTVANSYIDNFDNHVGSGSEESSSHAELRAALVIGAGAEWALAAHWRLRAEYLHAEFGSLSSTGIAVYLPQIASGNPITSTATLTADVVRVGLAYGF